ncbi:hypothetical protein NV379_18800 [Paenibacillus sp. N1-5-1-14]|uniref:hypothetical protein n=1 Tax=Paenibacillus radicibacter TaxID=2972488 RepID=UPI00215904E1|nr:hypothetical protein [Paenibacillus radicibacter]MCR8644707.1 hypothetical protein [Paenibacillus radicibacter]
MASMYRRSNLYRILALIVLILMLGLAGYKCYYSFLKINLYNQAAEQHAAGNILEAEDRYLEASNMRLFDYKNQEITDALEVLRPVTELKRGFMALDADLKAATQVNDVQSLVKVHNHYQTTKGSYTSKDEASRKLFEESEALYKIEAQLKESFTNVKAALMKQIKTNVSTKTFDSDTPILYLWQIPTAFFTNEKAKKKELTDASKAYDDARLDNLAQAKSFEEIINEVARIRSLYNTNEIQAEWLLPKLESYIQRTLAAQLKQNDLKTFIINAKKYQSSPAIFNTKSKVNTYIQTSIRSQFTRAEQLVSSKKFAEAIELYGILDSYQSTSEEVRKVEEHSLESDPNQLLRKATSSDAIFSKVTSMKGTNGVKMVAFGIADNQTLIMARLLGDGSIDKAETSINGITNIQSLQFTNQLGMSNFPVLLLEAKGSNRKSRFIAYEVVSTTLRIILDIEADGYTQDRQGVLIVDNPIGEGAGRQAYYEYLEVENRYVFSHAVSAVQDVTAGQLPSLLTGSTVRLSCEITSVNGSIAYVQTSNAVILIRGNFPFKLGQAVVTGTYTDKRLTKLDGEWITVYTIDSTNLEQ